MPLLIDGYNLLHATGVAGRAGSGLQGSREALLRLLAATIDPAERLQTTVVFDAAEAPPGLPRTVSHEGMTIRYASDYESADALIEELIADNHVPRSLLVVSSDHRLQRAARRRRAQFMDSDAWLAKAVRTRRSSRRAPPRISKAAGNLTDEETEYWLAEFGESSAFDATISKPGPKVQPATDDDELRNPFPPGYGEDLPDVP